MIVEAPAIGEGWLATARAILAGGTQTTYDGLPILELAHLTLVVASPRADDPVVAGLGDPERLAWMHANFTGFAPVPELGDADSYATRLRDYARSGRDQVAWVIEQLRADPASRSATITTFQPLTDSAYIPCVSLLDFWLRDGAAELVVYAHSIDFGTKGYANLVELAALQHEVATALDRPPGPLRLLVKSAHIYTPDIPYITNVLQATT